MLRPDRPLDSAGDEGHPSPAFEQLLAGLRALAEGDLSVDPSFPIDAQTNPALLQVADLLEQVRERWRKERGEAVSKTLKAVTGYQEMYAQLAQRESLLDEAQTVACVGSWEWDVATDRVTWSKTLREIFGVSDPNFAPSYAEYLVLVHAGDRQMVDDAVKRAFGPSPNFAFEHRIVRNAQTRFISARGRVVNGTDGRPIRMTGTAQDVTARVLQTQELKRSNRALREFAHAAAHDLRSPVRAVAGMADVLIDERASMTDAEVAENLRLMRDSLSKLDDLVAHLLEYAQAGNERLVLEPLDTAAALRSVVHLIDRPAAFTINIVEPMPVLTTAAGPFQRVFINLLTNAVKHHDRSDGVATVTATESDEGWAFVVSDDGPGVSESFRPHMFEMFSRNSSSLGTGMGLALVRRIVESVGGQVDLLPSPPGTRGASFRVLWPKKTGEGTVTGEMEGSDSAATAVG